MHKYKRAKVVYDNRDLAFCTVELLTMISSNDCREKLVSANISVVRKLFRFGYICMYIKCMVLDP